MNIEQMKAFLEKRAPSDVTAFEQVLVDLGVYDGQKIPAGDAGAVVLRVRTKLDAIATGRVCDFSEPEVGAELDGADAVLRIRAKRIPS